MSLASLAIFGNIKINEPSVVKKSYPAFWDDMKKIGFSVEEIG